MALIEERNAPSDVPTTNELDKIEDYNPGGIPTEIRLGQAVLMTMLDPPEAGSYIDISARLYIKHAGFDQNTPDSPKVPVRLSKIIVAWPLGEQMPKPQPKKKTKAQEDAEAEAAAADDQPPLFDEDGGASEEDYYDDGDEDQGDGNTLAAAETEDEEDNVVPFNGGPSFSDNDSDD